LNAHREVTRQRLSRRVTVQCARYLGDQRTDG
jgi:hypothetical protein